MELRTHTVRVTIPAGVAEGQLIRLAGQGGAGGEGGAVAGVFDEEERGLHLAGDGFLVGDQDSGDAAVGFQTRADLFQLLIFLLELRDLLLGGVVGVAIEEAG